MYCCRLVIEERIQTHVVLNANGIHTMASERNDNDRRCWPCALANSAVGLVIAWFPFAAMLLASNRAALPVAAAWGMVITVYVAYRLVGWGYLPLAERIATRTGLHDRVGPGSRSRKAERGDPPESEQR